jgi:hypothetical protein
MSWLRTQLALHARLSRILDTHALVAAVVAGIKVGIRALDTHRRAPAAAATDPGGVGAALGTVAAEAEGEARVLALPEAVFARSSNLQMLSAPCPLLHYTENKFCGGDEEVR